MTQLLDSEIPQDAGHFFRLSISNPNENLAITFLKKRVKITSKVKDVLVHVSFDQFFIFFQTCVGLF